MSADASTRAPPVIGASRAGQYGVAAGMWRDFVRGLADAHDGTWRERSTEAEVTWFDSATSPTDSDSLRLVYDEAEGSVYVCDRELRALGRLSAPSAAMVRGYANRVNLLRSGRVGITTFAPFA